MNAPKMYEVVVRGQGVYVVGDTSFPLAQIPAASAFG